MMKRPDESNKIAHHTTLYHSDYLIVRRGQEFQVKITFSRPYKPAEDKFALEFVIGELNPLSTTLICGPHGAGGNVVLK